MGGIKIFSNTPAKMLAKEICEILRTDHARQVVKRFADGVSCSFFANSV